VRAETRAGSDLEEPQTTGVFDRGASRCDAEFAIDRDRLRFDGMRRHVESFADLPERQMRWKVRQQAKLGGGERRGSEPRISVSFHHRLEGLRLCREGSEVRLSPQEVVDLSQQDPRTRGIAHRAVGPHELEARLDREVRQRIGEQRA
jgi:hypothetical protein